jgi:type I restriction-modification system DNA methylase subunit/restriction endonuclease S subunit
MGRSTVHYADNQTNNILKALHNKLRPAGTPVQRVEYILELLLLRMFEVKLKREKEFIELRVLFNEENAHQDKLFSHLLTLGSEQILPTLNKDFFPFYAEILKHARSVLAKNLNDSVIDQLVLIQEVFANSNFTNNVQSGNLHDVIGLIEQLDEACLLNSDLLGDAIESALSETGGTKDIGLFRTPDHIRHFMVGLVEPTIDDTLIDPACGTGGFLFNAYEYVLERIQAPYRQDDEEPLFPSRKSHPELQAWFKKQLADNPYPMPTEQQTHHFYRSGIYGIEYLGMIRKMAAVNFYVRHLNPANLKQGDSLHLFNAEHHESKTLVLANPPFGAERDKTAYANVWEDYAKESETTILFVKMMLDYLTVGGRCAVVVSEGFLTWEQGSAKALRKMLLQENKLQAVIGLPQGVFVSKTGQGPKTSILLFAKGTPTQQVWFYNIENDGYSKGTNRAVIADCQLVEALSLYHDYVKHGKTPPETRRSFSLSVDWLNIVDPRIKAKIRTEVREKLTLKQNEAREKLVARLDKKLNAAKTAKPNSKTEVFTEALYSSEITQFEQTWENKIQIEIAQAIDKAHSYSFNSSNYRSSLADNQLQAWDDLIQHHQPDSNGQSLDQRYAALLESSLNDALQHIAQFDPKNAIEADIVREYLSGITVEELQKYSELLKLDGILKSGAKYPLVTLKDYCHYEKGKFPTQATAEGLYPFVVTAKERKTADNYQLDTKAICIPLISSTGHGHASLKRIHYQEGKFALANLLFAAIPKDETVLNAKYLYHVLTPRLETLFVPLMKGTANVGMKMEDTIDVKFPLPPIEVQQQIVEQIERQQAIIEGADKVFDNWEVNIDKFSEICTKSNLYNLCNIDTGSMNANQGVENGEFPFFTCSKQIFRIDNYAFDCEAVLLAGNNGSADFNIKHYHGKFNAYQRTYVITSKNTNILNTKFLYYILSTHLKFLKENSIGAGTKYITLKMLENIEILLPHIEEQLAIVEILDNEVETLDKLCKMKTEAQAKITKLINAIWESS